MKVRVVGQALKSSYHRLRIPSAIHFNNRSTGQDTTTGKELWLKQPHQLMGAGRGGGGLVSTRPTREEHLAADSQAHRRDDNFSEPHGSSSISNRL